MVVTVLRKSIKYGKLCCCKNLVGGGSCRCCGSSYPPGRAVDGGNLVNFGTIVQVSGQAVVELQREQFYQAQEVSVLAVAKNWPKTLLIR